MSRYVARLKRVEVVAFGLGRVARYDIEEARRTYVASLTNEDLDLLESAILRRLDNIARFAIPDPYAEPQSVEELLALYRSDLAQEREREAQRRE